MFAAQVLHAHAGFDLTQKANALFACESFLPVRLFLFGNRPNLSATWTGYWAAGQISPMPHIEQLLVKRRAVPLKGKSESVANSVTQLSFDRVRREAQKMSALYGLD